MRAVATASVYLTDSDHVVFSHAIRHSSFNNNSTAVLRSQSDTLMLMLFREMLEVNVAGPHGLSECSDCSSIGVNFISLC